MATKGVGDITNGLRLVFLKSECCNLLLSMPRNFATHEIIGDSFPPRCILCRRNTVEVYNVIPLYYTWLHLGPMSIFFSLLFTQLNCRKSRAATQLTTSHQSCNCRTTLQKNLMSKCTICLQQSYRYSVRKCAKSFICIHSNFFYDLF